ncbi:MAG: alpha-amylase [Bacteroidales bacterium]|nr:alpha-amylase [Bacteroidales bacterium]
MAKFILYQMLIRVMGDRKWTPGGDYATNGSGKFNDITQDFLDSLAKDLSLGAIWYTGIIAHSTATSFEGFPADCQAIVKGKAGSPYAIRDYYDVAPELAVDTAHRLDEFKALIERTHKTGLKVVIDFVPNHVARSYNSKRNNFTQANFFPLDGPLELPYNIAGRELYKEDPALATGNDCFSRHPGITDWYDTVKLNYNYRMTWDKMLDILLYWADMGVDGFRCDMVELVTPEFFEWAIDNVKKQHPGTFFIAEVYDKRNYIKYAAAGFNYLYDKSGFYDALKAISTYREPAYWLTDEWQFLGSLQHRMLNFLENHDEQRIASDFFLGDARKAFAPLAVSMLFNTAPFMIYCGQEYGERGMASEGYSGQDGRTSIFDFCTLTWRDTPKDLQEEVHERYRQLTALAVSDIFAKGRTYDLMYANPSSECFDAQRVFTFMRGLEGRVALVAANFSDTVRQIKISIPKDAYDYFGVSRVQKFEEPISLNPFDYTVLLSE